MFSNGKKSGLSKAATAVTIVIVLATAVVGAVFATTKTTTVTQTVTQSTTVTSTVTSLQTPTANNTIDLRANSTVTLAVVGATFGGLDRFVVGTLIDPTIKVKAGTSVVIIFHSRAVAGGLPQHSFVIVNSKPPFPGVLNQSDVTPAFPGASTDNPIQPQKDQFTLSFTADRPGTYYYICGVSPHAATGMYGQFIVEA